MKFSALPLFGLLLVSCQEKRPVTTTVTPSASARVKTAPTAAKTQATYAGTYANEDSTDCALAITILQKNGRYFFIQDTTQGPLKVTQQDSSTYFTFVGLESLYPEGSPIEAMWQDSVLLIQNYGNAMNEYQRFGCEAKFLELRRQR